MFHVKHRLFSNAKAREDLAQDLLDIDLPDKATQCAKRQSQMLRLELNLLGLPRRRHQVDVNDRNSSRTGEAQTVVALA